MSRYLKHFIFSFLLLNCISSFGQLIVKPNDNKITYMGRVGVNNDSVSFYWPGTSATINFIGTKVSVTMKSNNEVGYFYAIVDNDVSKAFKFSTDNIKKNIVVASDLPYKKHTLLLYKLSNNTSENILYNFEIEGTPKLLPPNKLPKRKIEFYGDSITAGHGVDLADGANDSGQPQDFNNYFTYDALTARHFNAQYSIIARSGIGIMVSWFPEIMPEVYDRINPEDPNSKWDFSSYEPDIVVINLFQNDSWIVNLPQNQQFIARFGTVKPTEEFIISAYKNFVQSIRKVHPKSHIICALGNMDATAKDSKWPGYIEQAVKRMNDTKIHTVFFPYKNRGNHPNKEEQQMMANDLIGFIEKNIKW
ncbi:SGNH/GDSL hydrolase family protein [Flavobacterium sp.]|uniref:SGNH/GDSL hydrolase family protein n=1 Tax=Flavobacterium sp. TaxID=239 RepID=UPI002B617252|nr:GDSL-type esterase/lipase family protein [Flavobacterium sp.]HSD06944.1 GDSL-type esterase/lipase family protein [Flavobacterium sp.]